MKTREYYTKTIIKQKEGLMINFILFVLLILLLLFALIVVCCVGFYYFLYFDSKLWEDAENRLQQVLFLLPFGHILYHAWDLWKESRR